MKTKEKVRRKQFVAFVPVHIQLVYKLNGQQNVKATKLFPTVYKTGIRWGVVVSQLHRTTYL